MTLTLSRASIACSHALYLIIFSVQSILQRRMDMAEQKNGDEWKDIRAIIGQYNLTQNIHRAGINLRHLVRTGSLSVWCVVCRVSCRFVR